MYLMYLMQVYFSLKPQNACQPFNMSPETTNIQQDYSLRNSTLSIDLFLENSSCYLIKVKCGFGAFPAL